MNPSPYVFWCLLLFLIGHGSSFGEPYKDSKTTLTRFAFGSCNKEGKYQSFWPVVADLNPNLWIWLGDNIYGDSKNVKTLKSKYDLQFHDPHYKMFRESHPIIGIWDDHDFGENDANGDFEIKNESQQLCLDFLEEPAQTNRRKQEGIYTSYSVGEAGKKIKFILLDTRYHSESPSMEATLLGKQQWLWLEKELAKSDENLVVICSGIQVIPIDHRFEKWNNYPNERKRLLELLDQPHLKNVILLSGDRHIHEMSVLPRDKVNNPILEVTSSGLTHSYTRFSGEKNRFRIGEVYAKRGFGCIDIVWKGNPAHAVIKIYNIEGQEELTSRYRLILP